MRNAFDPEDIYEKLEEILSFESSSTDKRKWNDPAFQAYEERLKSLPQIISLEELKKYHEFLKEDQEKRKDFVEKIEELEEKNNNLSYLPENFVKYMLDELQRVTSPQSYAIVEKAVRTALTIYKLQELSEDMK